MSRTKAAGHVIFNLCTAGFESISPCTGTTTVAVHGTGSVHYQIQNNSSMDDPMVIFCSGTIASCTVTPVNLTVRAGRSANFTLNLTGGAAGGTGVMTIDASGNVDLEATETVTVNPVAVTPKGLALIRVPDTTFTQSFTVQNLGNNADTVNLTVGCTAGFSCSLLTGTPLAIAATSSGTANVSVTTGSSGTAGTVTLHANATHGVGGDTGSVTISVPAPIAPTVSTTSHNGYNRDLSLCAVSCFNVTAAYTTPAYTSMDVPRSVSLVYSSAMAYPLAVVQVDVKDPSYRLAQQLSLSAIRGGVNETFTNGTTELYVSQGSTDTTTKRLAGQLSTAPATGIYYDTTIIKSRWTTGPYAGTVLQASVPTTLLIDNEQASPYGAGWSIAGLQHLLFTSDSLSIAIADGTGSIALFTRPTKTSPWVSPAGDFTTLQTMLSGGSVWEYWRTTTDGTRFEFSPTGFLLSERNRFGDSTCYHYNGSNLLTAIVDPVGDSLTIAYTSGKLSSITDPGGRITRVTIDGTSDNLTSITDPTSTTTFTGAYDTHHRLTQMTDRGGNTWLYRYDFASTIASDSTPAVVADNAAKRLGTHFRSTLAAELIDTASHTGSSATPATPTVKDSVWARVAPPDVDSVRLTVDPYGDPNLTEDLSAQTVTTTTRNAASQATQTVTTVHGRTVQHLTAAWSGGDMTQLSNLLVGATVTFRYDPSYHLLTAMGGSTVPDTIYLNAFTGIWADSEKIGAGPNVGVETFVHDAHGRLTQVTDPAGHVSLVTFDSTGFKNTHSTTAQNRVTTYRYDRYGRADSTTLPGGAVITTLLDSLNRTRKTAGPNGVHVTYAYDSLSNIRTITDAKGQTYQYTWNALAWLIAQINADTTHTLSARTDSFFYNAAGFLTKHRDRNALATTTAYDGSGRVVTLTLADGRVTRYGYDPNGLFQTDSSAASIDTIKIDTTGLVQTEFTKQAGRAYTIVSTANTLGAIQTFVFKQASTLLDSLSFGYDGTLRLDTLRTGALKTFFTYANDGLLSTWRLPTGDSAIATYSKTHEPLTRAYSRTGVNVLYESLARDTLDRVVQQTTGALRDTVRFFAYDSTGRLKTYADSVPVDSLICVPDPNGQDGQRCSPAGGWTLASQSNYTYDSANNRTDLSALLAPGNRLTSFNGYTLTYDNAGNVTHKSKAGFDQYYYWNSIGQLDSVVTNGTAVHFGYDGQGRRVQKRTATQTLRYIYTGQELIAEVDSASGATQKIYRYYPGVDNPHSVKEATGTYYYFSGIGTPGVVGLIDSTGTVKNRYRYAPWGGLEDSLETVPNVLKLAGREYDAETHLYFNHARYYDPQLARFISEDPAGESGGVNQYAYAGDDPVGAVDPTGLMVREVCDGVNVEIDGLVYCGVMDGDPTDGLGGGKPGALPPMGGGGPGKPKPHTSKHFGLTTSCSSSASQVMGAVEDHFPWFGNYSRWGGLEAVAFYPPSRLGPGSTIGIIVEILGFKQGLSVNVQSINSQSMTFTTNPGHLLYPASITFATSPASPGSINFNIDLGGTIAKEREFNNGAAGFEDAQWHHFLNQVAGFCKAGGQ